MGEYLDPVVKTDHCAQYVDNTGIAAKFAKDCTWNIRAVLECIRMVGLKMTVGGCLFGVRQTKVPDRTISLEGVSGQTQQIQNFAS